MLNSNFESSVPGLYFTGLISAKTFGPANPSLPVRIILLDAFLITLRAIRERRHVLLRRSKSAPNSGLASELTTMAALPGLDKRFPALIFKASRGTIHHGAVGIARSLGQAGVPVYAIVEDRYTPLAVSRYVTRAFIWKRWPGERKAFLSAMSAIGEIINQPTVLIPMDDLSAVYVAENASILS